MRQSGVQGQQGERISVTVRNRNRLILQNRKLLGEVFKLEQMINAVIEKQATEEWTGLEQAHEISEKYREQKEEQLRTIVRLKKEVKAIRASLAEHKYDQVRNEQNQVTFLRREHMRLTQERDTLAQKKREKEEALEYHQPINAQTASTLEQYKKTKNTNGELKAKLHQLEREVGKYHNLRELAKSSVPRQYDNPDYQFMKIDNEMATMRKEMKKIEQKWRSKVEAIDREYFSFRDIRIHKTEQIETLQKELKNYENHIAAIRDEAAVASDRERINALTISPQKRKEMQELIEDEKKRLKRLSPKASDRSKSERGKNNDKNKPSKGEFELKLISESKEETNSQKLPEQPVPSYEITQYSEKKEESSGGAEKPTKLRESIGVGTSFYYADD